MEKISKDGRSVLDHLLKKPVVADTSVEKGGGYDLFIVPGGDTSTFSGDKELISAVRKLGSASKTIASVCTGAFLIAGSGLADGRVLATHWLSHRRFEAMFPNIQLARDRRYTRDGNLWSSAGISAGIDMTLNFVAREFGEDVSKKCQGLLEYFPEPPWTREEVSEAL